MRIYGLIGYPLAHSFSLDIFSKKFTEEGIKDTLYRLFPLASINELPELLNKEKDLKGFNVTSPYKVAVMKFLDRIDPVAREAGAVNTVRIEENRTLTGFNTDVYGFEASLRPLLKPYHKKALVLGTGGASGAVCIALKKLGISFKLVSRSGNPFLSYDELDRSLVREHKLIIQATPLGTYPHIEQAPVFPYKFLENEHLCYDLVYNPQESLFLYKSGQYGAQVKNGLEMLNLQALKAWDIWTKGTDL